MENKETLEEAAERIVKNKVGLHYFGNETSLENLTKKDYVIEGAKWQQEQDKNKYSEEEVIDLWNWLNDGFIIRKSLPSKEELVGWFEQFKKK